jgi:hypothetical protein
MGGAHAAERGGVAHVPSGWEGRGHVEWEERGGALFL